MEKAVPFRFVFAVAIDVLTKESDLFIPLIDKPLAFFYDAFRGSRDLSAAGIGDDAIGAKLIAAADNRDKCFDRIVSFSN